MFSPCYQSARRRFLEAAVNAGAGLDRLSPAQDDPAADLDTHIAWLGAPLPRKALIVVSGIHGVEGFAGAAVQLGLLKMLPDLPVETALILVHTLNPYGMHNLRRVNANNVDLNRNFIFDDEGFLLPSAAYAALDRFLNPPKPPAFDFFSQRLLLKSLTYGRAALTQTVAGGQYLFPKSLFYGGTRLEPEAAGYMSWLQASPLTGADQIMVLDLHTGLGRMGVQSLLLRSDAIDHQELSRQLQLQVMPDGKATDAMAYDHAGGSSGVYRHLFPRARLICLTVEYGTYDGEHVLRALRAENQYHHYGDGRQDHWSKRKLKEAFCPVSEEWRQRVVGQGVGLAGKALSFLASSYVS